MKDFFGGGARVVAHLAWVKDTEHSWVSGELCVLSDGVVLERLGNSFWSKNETTWTFYPWSEIGRITGEVTKETAVAAMRRHGYYDLSLPGPVPPHESTAVVKRKPGEPTQAVPFTSVDQLPDYDAPVPAATGKPFFFSLARWRSKRK